VLLTFLSQCVDYSKVPHSKSLSQVVIPQCTRNMSGVWNLGIWLYSFFFIWKSVQYFFEIRRLIYVRDFYVHLLEIPEPDMQTVSWQDVVARIMTLRDQNPKTATNIPSNLRRYIGSQSKERLDAHDIANRLMRKDNYLIAMINKDILNLSLPLPFLRGRQLFSKTMEWYLHYGILDMAFNERGQVRQDFLRADRRGILSQKLKQRLYFAGFLNLIFAPVVLAYVVIVYFFTYYHVSCVLARWHNPPDAAMPPSLENKAYLVGRSTKKTRSWQPHGNTLLSLNGNLESSTSCLTYFMRDSTCRSRLRRGTLINFQSA